ncbi:hypothetical protein [Pseudomonas moorei]|uniref:Uncharacterized protein n=1 Tax=Pseudomonas moorei TaxID=395599 RepID=A0A1H1CUN8_9PSED|nr:hypothetical protein [Pseudomonas moorei]KAB0504646.1 hypothetical protein F7R06_13030 [Pseudomonas moorei]PPA06032.1 hypothetical protein C4E44_00790 [Pseudomonas sp. MWU12-2312b]SDQ67975.1 hypothetical protein SAMN04490195_1398 [Pseudomonas moorei]
MSTLNEIAANHARMAKAKEEETTALSERTLHVVGSIEIPCKDAQQHVSLHLIAGVQESNLGQVVGYSL